MLDQSLVQSGFDAEILLGERQLTAVLLGLVDAGTIPMVIKAGESEVTLALLGPVTVDRTYTPHPDAPGLPPVSDTRRPFEVGLLFDHPSGADVRVHVALESPLGPVEGDLFIGLALETDRDEAGSLEAARLNITVLDIDSPALPAVEALEHITKAEILAEIKEKVDRAVDLGGLGAFKRVQDIAVRKLAAEAEHPSAFGLYVNLRIQNGPEPESLKAARGDVDAARNFLPAGSDAAMASRNGLYGDLAADAFHRFAEIDEEGNVSHPWHKSPFKKTSEVLGKIVGVSVAPILNTNTLKIDVEVEYEIDDFFDPNGHLVIELTPSTDSDGTLTWHVNADFHGSVALEIIGFVVLAALFTGVFALGGLALAPALSLGFMAGSIGDFAGHRIVDAIRSGRIERKVDAGLPDVVSGRVTLARRRWDPFYTTHHQIALRPDGALVNGNGIALWGRAVLDREFEPVADAVIRDKRAQAPSPPTHLRYRIADAEEFREEFTAIAPGTDRRTIEQHDAANEPTMFELSIEEIVERMAEGRIVPDLAYVPKRVDMRQNQVHSILAISEVEIKETPDAVIAAFETATRERIAAEQGEAIREEIEATPEAADLTPEEIDALVKERIEAEVAPLVEAFASGPLDGPIEAALLATMKFDLPPEHLAALEKKKILHLDGLEIITMRAPGHQGFMYYRDKPDFFKPDNLHSLPRYRETPSGPVIL